MNVPVIEILSRRMPPSARRWYPLWRIHSEGHVAVRVSPDHKPVIVGAPACFDAHQRPKLPRDLLQHRCINFRHGSAGLYRWEFEKGEKALSIAVSGPLIVDDADLVLRAAIDGVGLAYLFEQDVALHVSDGRLVGVLQDCCQPYSG